MLGATFFKYNGISSEEYGLKFLDFNDDTVEETPAFSRTPNTIQPRAINRLLNYSFTYDSPPQYTFSVISEEEITDLSNREIMRWLFGPKTFKQFRQIISKRVTAGDGQTATQCVECEHWYNCIFTTADTIYVCGERHGYRLTAVFDSVYARTDPATLTVTQSGNYTLSINSDVSDDEYVYPIVSFSGDLTIENTTTGDTGDSAFIFSDVPAGVGSITVDNEIKFVDSSTGANVFSSFKGRHWLRLKPGNNDLTITYSGDEPLTITCPQYVLIGF